MTFLPIVDRELREGARRRGTYGARAGVALIAILAGLAGYGYFFINRQPSSALGPILFWGLSGAAMLFCLLAGRRSTADCLSQEKREGTLGLLFLTDLKGYDVVLGKLAATSVAGFYALLGVLPVLAVPLLAGGITRGELLRTAVALVNTFFFSLAIGLLASALSREYRAAMAMNFFLFLLLVAAPSALGLGIAAWHRVFVSSLFYSCPIFSFVRAADLFYSRPEGAAVFWWSIGITHGLAWLLVLLACWIVPRTWGDKPQPAPSPSASRRWQWSELGKRASYGSPEDQAVFRRQALDQNAFFWLASRARLKPVHVWIFLAAVVVWWFDGWRRSGRFWLASDVYIATLIGLNFALKLWIAQEAVQRLSEDRRSGAFELLLSTPITIKDILHGQWLAMRRQFLGPIIMVLALELVSLFLLPRGSSQRDANTFFLAETVLFPMDAAALIWVAMLGGMTAPNQTRAVSFAVASLLVLPSVAVILINAVAEVCDSMGYLHWRVPWFFFPALWFAAGIAADAGFGLYAWQTLRRRFRDLASQPLAFRRKGAGGSL